VHKSWSFCSTIWYFQSRTKHKNSSSAPSHNEKRRRANTQGDACERNDLTYAKETTNESSDLAGLDTEDGEVLEEEEVTWEENELEDGNETEGNEEDETVSNDGMEHDVIVVAPGRPRRSRLLTMDLARRLTAPIGLACPHQPRLPPPVSPAPTSLA